MCVVCIYKRAERESWEREQEFDQRLTNTGKGNKQKLTSTYVGPGIIVYPTGMARNTV